MLVLFSCINLVLNVCIIIFPIWWKFVSCFGPLKGEKKKKKYPSFIQEELNNLRAVEGIMAPFPFFPNSEIWAMVCVKNLKLYELCPY